MLPPPKGDTPMPTEAQFESLSSPEDEDLLETGLFDDDDDELDDDGEELP